MRIGICDDCEEYLMLLSNICSKYNYTDIVLYRSGEELLKDKNCSKIELLFLDIEMDGQSGLDVKDILEHTNSFTFIVFCTSHIECMMDAFGQNVISFLSKPFTAHAVEQCIKKALHLRKDFYPIYIAPNTTVPCCNILYIHVEGKYSVIYFADSNTILSRKSLKEWKKELCTLGFCSISQSYVVNLKHVKKIEDKTLFLSNQVNLKISRRNVNEVNEAYRQYRISRMRYDG